MKCFILFLSLTYFSHSVFSQTESIITFMQSGYQINSLNGYGFENINLTTVSNITNSNPSLITNLKPYSIGITKQFNSDIDEAWIADIGYKHISNWIPQSGGIILPLNDLSIGIGMSQVYNAQVYFGKIPITTAEQPDGTGEFLSPTHKTNVTTTSIQLAYPFENLFDNNDKLSIGGQLNLHLVYHEQSIVNSGFKSDFNDVNWNFGLNYKLSSSSLQLGLFFEKGFKFSNTVTFPNSNIVREIDSGNTERINALIPLSFKIAGFLPDRLTLGLLIHPTNNLGLSGNIINVFWNSYQENIHNQTEFSANIFYTWNNFITTSFGFYLSDKDYFGETAAYFDMDNLSAAFLSFGTILNINNFNIELALADSHLSSGEWRKQTIFKFGLNYYLL